MRVLSRVILNSGHCSLQAESATACIYILQNTKNWGIAFEEPDPATRFNRELLKPTRHESSGGPTCVVRRWRDTKFG